MSICEICKAKLKDPRSKRHINSKKHQSALKKLGMSFAIPERAKPIRTVHVPPKLSTSVEQRLDLLEGQIKYIMDKLKVLDSKLVDFKPSTSDSMSNYSIKNEVKQLISPGESLSIDEIRNSRKLRNVDWRSLEKILIEMVDEEIFDVSEGRSKYKLDRNIGRLIRR